MAEHSGILALKKERKIPLLVMLLAPSLFIIAFIVAPFLVLVHTNLTISFFHELTGSNATAVLTRRALGNSLLQGSISSVTCLTVGYPLGIFLGKYSFRLRKLVASFTVIPFFLPSLVVVFAFLTGFSSGSALSSALPFLSLFGHGLWGIIAVNTFFNAPLVALFTMSSIEGMDPSYNEAAMTLGASPSRRMIGIWGHDGLLSALGACVLTFTYSFAGFAAPLVIGGPGNFTMDAWIYFMIRTLNNFPAAIALALVEVLVLIIPAMIYIFISSRTKRVTSSSSRMPESGKRDRYFYLGFVYMAVWISGEIYLFLSVALASVHISSGLGPEYFMQLFGAQTGITLGISALSAIVNSLFYGLVSSLIVVILGLLWMVGRRRMGRRMGFAAEPLQYIPLIISSVLLAFAISNVLGTITPDHLLWILIVVAQAAVAVPVVLRVIDGGFSSVSNTLSEAALTLRGNPFFEVELPLARGTFASALMFGFAISLGEFSATNFIATPHFYSLTVIMYNLQTARLFGASYAAAVVLLLTSLISFYVIQRLGERFVGFR